LVDNVRVTWEVLGLSLQTIAINNTAATETAVFGPLFPEDAPEIPIGGDFAGAAASQPIPVDIGDSVICGPKLPS
jgi:hypothetical protein